MTASQNIEAESDAAPLHRGRRWPWWVALPALILAMATSLSVGAAAIGPGDAWTVVLSHMGIGSAPSVAIDGVIWAIRLPRILLGVAVGAALGAAGMALQGLFRTPLADPHLLGLGPGAAIGAVLGAAGGGIQGAIAGGAAAGLIAGFAVRRVGRSSGGDPARLILSGVALGAAFSAWVGFFVFGLDRSTVAPIEFWLLGSLTGSTWRAFATAAVLIAVGIVGLMTAGRSLDLLSLGESTARSLGVDVGLVSTMVILGAGLITGAAVGAVGVIGFVGLLGPAIARRLVGPKNKSLIAMSAIAGALLMVVADTVARTAVSPIELPAGLVTAAIGGPVFIWLISRMRRWT